MEAATVTPIHAATVADPPMLPDAFMSTTSLVMDSNAMTQMLALAEVMSTAVAAVPAHFRGKKGDCLAVVMQSMQWGMNPYAVAQKTFLVNGTLGYEAQLVNAVIIARAPVVGRPRFEWFGPWEKIVGKFVERVSRTKKDDHGEAQKYRAPDWKIEDEAGCGVKVWATFKGEKEPRELTLLMTQARTRNSTLWADDPKQQLAYLAIKRWSRLHCPDVILGVYTPDELAEPRGEIDVTPSRSDASGAGSAEAEALAEELLTLLLGSMERDAANGGYAEVNAAWKRMTAQQRAMIPEAEWTRIKGIAMDTDAARKKSAAAPKTEAPAPKADPQPAAAEKTGTQQQATGPTYAHLMDSVKGATDADALLQIQSDATHLTAQMQEEIRVACNAKAKALANA